LFATASRSAFARLGFKRATESAQEKGTSVLTELLTQGQVNEKDGLLYPSTANN